MSKCGRYFRRATFEILKVKRRRANIGAASDEVVAAIGKDGAPKQRLMLQSRVLTSSGTANV